eukprot:Pgem_evm1s11341
MEQRKMNVYNNSGHSIFNDELLFGNKNNSHNNNNNTPKTHRQVHNNLYNASNITFSNIPEEEQNEIHDTMGSSFSDKNQNMKATSPIPNTLNSLRAFKQSKSNKKVSVNSI